MHRSLTRIGAFSACAIVVGGFLAACGSSGSGGSGSSGSGSSAGGSFNVTEIVDLTGPFSAGSVPFNGGAQTYFSQLNSSGGIKGKRVKVTVLDSQGSTTTATADLQQALSGNPVAILESGSSTEFAAMLPFVAQYPGPVWTVGAADSDLYPAPRPNVYMVIPSATQNAHAMVAEMKIRLGGSLAGKRLAYFGLVTPFSDALVKALKADLAASGATLAADQRFPGTATSFASQAGTVAAAKPDGVFLGGDAALSRGPVAALRVAGLTKVPLLGDAPMSDTPVIAQVAAPNYYALRAGAYADAGSKILAAAESAHVSGTATDVQFSLGYAAAAAVGAALTACGTDCTPAKLVTATDSLGNFEVPSEALFGPIKLSSKNHAALSQGQFFTWDASGSKVVAAGPPVPLS